jgi:hypothetical protein
MAGAPETKGCAFPTACNTAISALLFSTKLLTWCSTSENAAEFSAAPSTSRAVGLLATTASAWTDASDNLLAIKELADMRSSCEGNPEPCEPGETRLQRAMLDRNLLGYFAKVRSGRRLASPDKIGNASAQIT